VVLACAQGFVSPAASGLVSVYASPREQGATLGAAQALGALGRMLGPEVIGKTYDLQGSRAAFLLAAAVMALAWVATWGLERTGAGHRDAAVGAETST
jgi:MFS family permease